MTAAAAPSPEEAAAASSGVARRLLDAALSRAIATLAHDLRNTLGVVSMQVEAISARANGASCDLRAVAGHAGVAADHIERLADMTNALVGFARGRSSSDLALISGEAAALVPMRTVRVEGESIATVGPDAVLVRAIVLEAMLLALGVPSVPVFRIHGSPVGATLEIVSSAPIVPDEAVEWVVQFRSVGGSLEPSANGLLLRFPPLA